MAVLRLTQVGCGASLVLRNANAELVLLHILKGRPVRMGSGTVVLNLNILNRRGDMAESRRPRFVDVASCFPRSPISAREQKALQKKLQNRTHHEQHRGGEQGL
jgi:hypothetical protein